jgi:hypothetical protein
VKEREVQGFAEDVVDGDGREAIGACAGDPELARAVSRAAARRLVERASSHRSAVDPELFVWPKAQDAIVALAKVPGADAPTLAGALMRCCIHEPVSGESDQLGDEGLRLILEHHAGVVEQLIPLGAEHGLHSGSLSPPWPSDGLPSLRFLTDAMWSLHGAEGARWMDVLIDHAPHAIVSRRPRAWTPEDWTLRYEVLSARPVLPSEAYSLESAMLDERDPAPREAAPALVRYACSRFTDGQDLRAGLGRTANVLAGHRRGDPPRDAELFWWDASTDDQVAALRWLIELSGPEGSRQSLVDAAVASGCVSAAAGAALSAELDRPLWVDRDVPWVVTEVREEEDAQAPGDLAALLGAGRVRTRTVVAVHPRHGRADAAVEVVANADSAPLSWDAVGDGRWVARGADGQAVRAVRDLGVLGLELTAAPPSWFVHERVPADEEDAPPWPSTIDARYLRDLAEAGAPLRHQRLALREALHRRGVSEYSSALVMSHVRDGIALVRADRGGRSVLGGSGRLPAGAPWPALSDDGRWFLAPLAEIALDELPALEPLPADGTLLVFQETETWSAEHDPLTGTRVLYVPGSVELHAAPPPPGDVLFPIQEKPLRGVAVPIPGEGELVMSALEFADDRETTIAAMNELMEGWWPEHWLLGASRDIQGPSRLEVPYWLEQASAQTRARFRPDELDPGRWTLLAQINEDDEVDIGIGDGGSFYLYILEEDLRERRYDRIIGFMQCH